MLYSDREMKFKNLRIGEEFYYQFSEVCGLELYRKLSKDTARGLGFGTHYLLGFRPNSLVQRATTKRQKCTAPTTPR